MIDCSSRKGYFHPNVLRFMYDWFDIDKVELNSRATLLKLHFTRIKFRRLASLPQKARVATVEGVPS